MGRIVIPTMIFGSLSSVLLLASEKNDQNLSTISSEVLTSAEDTQTNTKGSYDVQSVREILGGYDPMDHAKLQVRAGYIGLNEEGSTQKDAYALGGHFHLYSKRWNGLMLGGEAYTVLNLGINQNPATLDPDFFDADGESFILLSQAYVDGKWGNTEVKLGRQLLNTPHIDADDIRMMPNYYLAYLASNRDIDGLTLSVGLVDQMAGWENGIDSSKFVDIYETIGAPNSTDGIYYASAVYEGIKDLSLSLWYYDYNQIATIWYAEAGYSYTFNETLSLSVGLQYDKASNRGESLLGTIGSNTFGVSAEVKFEELGITLLSAYNKDDGETGATSLNLGGGPFFTSMEDQTLDAVEYPGSAWMVGAGYDFEKMGLNGLAFGIAYGQFEAEDASLYESAEFDAVLEYTLNDKLSLTAAYTSVTYKNDTGTDFQQLRLFANYNF